MDDKNKYNNALEKLQEALAPKDGCEISGLTKGCIEEIFPELKELEDEKIRKSIIKNLKGNMYRADGDYDLLNKQISWFEKQGEKPQGKTALEAVEEEKVDNANKVEQSFTWSEDDEQNLKRAIWYVENPALNVVKDIMLSKWLKSIKERIYYKKKLIDIIDKAAEWWLIHDSYSKDTNNLVNDFKKDLLKYVNISE